MRIDDLLDHQRPVFSVEFFPPKTVQGVAQLFETVEALKPLEPDYVSVTYGAGGATRDGTVEIAQRIRSEHGIEVMAHLSCVGETREGLTSILDRFCPALWNMPRSGEPRTRLLEVPASTARAGVMR